MTKQEESEKRHTHARRSVKSFFGRHERALTFVGALVVFLTFVMHEGVREYLRDTADAVRAAEAKLDAFQLIGTLVTLATTPGEIVEKETTLTLDRYPQHGDSAEDQFRADLAKADDVLDVRPFYRTQLFWTENYYDQTPTAFDILPLTDKLKMEREELKKASDEMIKTFDAIPPISKAELHKMTVEARGEEVQTIVDTFDTFNKAAVHFNRLRADAERQIRDKANEKRDRAQSWYDRATKTSYLLYTVGWGLGLIGKLSGSSVFAGE